MVFAVYWPSAGAAARAGRVLELTELGRRHPTTGVRPYPLEDVLDGDVAPLEPSGTNRPAVEHQRGQVEPEQRHGRAGKGLVAPDQRDHAVEEVAPADQLDGVGDHLAADQRGLHPLGAHGDAVADGDGVELHRRAARGPDALLHLFREPAEVEVAGHGLGPGAGHADERPRQVLGAEADGLEHRPRRGAVRALGERAALVARVRRHQRSSMGISCLALSGTARRSARSTALPASRVVAG